MDDFSEEIKSVVSEVINQVCDKDGTLNYYIDYSEMGTLDSADDIAAIATHLAKGLDLATAASWAFWDIHDDTAHEITWQEEDYLYDQIEAAISKYDAANGTDLRTEWDDMPEHFEILDICGYNGVNIDAIDFFPSTIYLDIELGTPQEVNHEGYINECFGDYNGEGDPENPELQNNMLVKFLHSQGLDTMDVFDENATGKVINSVKNELDNMTSNINFLTVCGRFDLADGARLLGGKFGFITINPGTTMGLFDTWNGGGSTLEIEMDSAWTVSSSNVSEVRISSNSKSGHYTIPDVYGIYANDDTFYKSTISVD